MSDNEKVAGDGEERVAGEDGQEQEQHMHVHVMMPPGLGLHLLQRAEPPVMDDKTMAEHTEFAIRMEKLFREVGTKDIDAVVVLVKTRVDAEVPKLDGDIGQTTTVRGFELDGGMVGGSEEILAMLMHLTESAQRQAMGISQEPVPEGKSEADRCLGCGGFHDGAEVEQDPGKMSLSSMVAENQLPG